jgi:hypothetical protein
LRCVGAKRGGDAGMFVSGSCTRIEARRAPTVSDLGQNRSRCFLERHPAARISLIV